MFPTKSPQSDPVRQYRGSRATTQQRLVCILPRPHPPDRDGPDTVHGQASTAAPNEEQAAVLKTGLSPHRKKSSLYHAFEVNKTDICVLSISYVAVNEDQILFSMFSLKTEKLDHGIWAMLDLHLDSN